MYIEILLIAVGLSMDAFAVSVSNGMAISNLRLRDALKFGLFFGLFQAFMPLLGWLAGSLFSTYITNIDHWIAFLLLAYIGGKMVRDARESDEPCGCTNIRVLIILSIATSIDALAAGITFAFMPVNILVSILIIGSITFLLCTLGALLGKQIGSKVGHHAQTAGGIVLILMGVKILVEHLFF